MVRWTVKRLSHTYTCIHSPPNLTTIQTATQHWVEFHVLYSRSFLLLHFNIAECTWPHFFLKLFFLLFISDIKYQSTKSKKKKQKQTLLKLLLKIIKLLNERDFIKPLQQTPWRQIKEKKNSIAQKAPIKITFEVLVNHASGLMLSSSSTFIIRL